MFKFIKDFFSLLTVSQRKNFFLFQFLIVIMSFIEITSIISITPFMALVADPTILSRDNFLATLYLKYNLELYEFIFVKPIKFIGFILWKKGDQNTIDRYGPDGFSKAIKFFSNKAVKFQSGFIYDYAFVMLLGLSLLLTYLIIN